MAKKQKQKAKQAARKAGKGSALVKKKTIQQQPGGSGKRMLVPKHAKQGKAHKPVARPVSSEKLALKARRREEQAARERAKAAEYAACPKCPKCSLPSVSRGGMVFCSKAWAPASYNHGLYPGEQFYPGGANEEGGTGCGWSETPVKGAGEATCKRCGSTVTCTDGGEGGWAGFWWKRECDNPHCGYKYSAKGVIR